MLNVRLAKKALYVIIVLFLNADFPSHALASEVNLMTIGKLNINGLNEHLKKALSSPSEPPFTWSPGKRYDTPIESALKVYGFITTKNEYNEKKSQSLLELWRALYVYDYSAAKSTNEDYEIYDTPATAMESFDQRSVLPGMRTGNVIGVNNAEVFLIGKKGAASNYIHGAVIMLDNRGAKSIAEKEMSIISKYGKPKAERTQYVNKNVGSAKFMCWGNSCLDFEADNKVICATTTGNIGGCVLAVIDEGEKSQAKVFIYSFYAMEGHRKQQESDAKSYKESFRPRF